MTYSVDKDVASKYSHLKISSNVIVKDYREEAYNEINMKLRKLYLIPIDSEDSNDLTYLKSIESRLAAGNILIAISTVDQLEEVNEYGKFLIKQAHLKLDDLINEKIILTGATQDTDKSDNVIDPPVISGSAADDYATFDRPISGIENDALEGIVDSKKYNSLEDNKEVI